MIKMKVKLSDLEVGLFIDVIAESKEEALKLEKAFEKNEIKFFSHSFSYTKNVCGKTPEERKDVRTFNDKLTIQIGKSPSLSELTQIKHSMTEILRKD